MVWHSIHQVKWHFTYAFIFILIHAPLGNIYIADTQNSRIRKVIVSTGIIATVAGIGTGSYSGDNGPATSASLYAPVGIALDSAGMSPLYLFLCIN